jgi:hypothetical protein
MKQTQPSPAFQQYRRRIGNIVAGHIARLQAMKTFLSRYLNKKATFVVAVVSLARPDQLLLLTLAWLQCQQVDPDDVYVFVDPGCWTDKTKTEEQIYRQRLLATISIGTGSGQCAKSAGTKATQIDQVPGPPQAPPMSQQFSTTVPGPPQAAPMAGQLPTTVPGTPQAIPIPSQGESYFRMQSDCEQLCVRSPVGRGSEVIAILLRGLSKATNSQQKSSLPDFIGIAKFYTGVFAVLGWLAPEKEMALLAAADKLVRYACNGLVLLACSFRCEAQAA